VIKSKSIKFICDKKEHNATHKKQSKYEINKNKGRVEKNMKKHPKIRPSRCTVNDYTRQYQRRINSQGFW